MTGTHQARFPAWGWVGLALIAVSWPLNWMLPGLRTHIFFFPLWLGYILVMDGLVYRRTRTSIWHRSRSHFAWTFAASIPIWWFFELVNHFTRNWHYEGRQAFTGLEFALFASIAFSTVLPAVSETAEFLLSFRWLQRIAPGPPWGATARSRWLTLVGGLALLALLLLLPLQSYAATWVAPGLILMPIAQWLRRSGAGPDLSRGDWRQIVAFAFAALLCGFFWELWNAYSFPRWHYATPGFDHLPHLFAMPLPGYLGYLPFGVTLAFCADLVRPRR
jgi:hypothetical protein